MRSKKFNLPAGGIRSPAQKVYILHKKLSPHGALCAKPPMYVQSPPIGRPSPRFIIQRTTAAGSGDRSSSDRATLGQYLVNCLFRVSSSKGLAGEDEIISGHAIDHEL